MRSAILVGIMVFLVTVAGALSISWYAQSVTITQAIETMVADAAQQGITITYEKLETTGFPKELKAVITRPRIQMRIDQLAKSLAATATGTAQKAQLQNLPEWQETLSHEGIVVIGVNALSDNFSISSVGNMESQSIIAGQTFTTRHEQSAPVYCSLSLERGSIFADLWSIMSIVRSDTELLEDFRLFDCSLPASASFAMPEKDLLAGMGPFRFYVSMLATGPKRDIRFYLSGTDFEITQAGDAIYNRIVALLSPGEVRIPHHLSAYGKQRLDIDLTYGGSENFTTEAKLPFIINLAKFDIQNAAYRTSIKFSAKNTNTPKQREAALSFRADSEFTPTYNAMLDELLTNLIQQAYSNPSMRTPELEGYFKTYTQEDMKNIIRPAMPDFAGLQKTIQSLDISYKGRPNFDVGEYTINNIELSSAAYGIRAVGLTQVDSRKPPQGTFSITCSNCPQLINDLTAYLQRLSGTLAYFNPELSASVAPAPDFAQNTTNYLSELAGPDKTNFSYEIASDEQGNVTVNGKPFTVITNRFNQYLTPMSKEPSQRNRQSGEADGGHRLRRSN